MQPREKLARIFSKKYLSIAGDDDRCVHFHLDCGRRRFLGPENIRFPWPDVFFLQAVENLKRRLGTSAESYEKPCFWHLVEVDLYLWNTSARKRRPELVVRLIRLRAVKNVYARWNILNEMCVFIISTKLKTGNAYNYGFSMLHEFRIDWL